VKASSAMVASIFNSRRDGKDWKMVQRREQRKTQTGAGTAAQVMEGLETVAASAMEMYQKDGADALTVTDAHAVLEFLRRKAREAARARGRQTAAVSQNEAEESDASEEETAGERERRGGGARGGRVPWGDSGSAGEPEGQDRRAPVEAWSQLSGVVRVELTQPLRVESGQTSSPGVDPSRRQPVNHDLRQGRPRPPTLEKRWMGGASRVR